MNRRVIPDELRQRVAELEARKPLTRAEVVAVLIRQAGGVIPCGCGCGEPLAPLTEGVRDEHVIALGYRTGDANELRNREFWRLPCSKAKDKADLKAIAKCKRLAGETCTAPGKPISSRGFDKTKTRGFDGKVRARSNPPSSSGAER